jgi:hypothetical protein
MLSFFFATQRRHLKNRLPGYGAAAALGDVLLPFTTYRRNPVTLRYWVQEVFGRARNVRWRPAKGARSTG